MKKARDNRDKLDILKVLRSLRSEDHTLHSFRNALDSFNLPPYDPDVHVSMKQYLMKELYAHVYRARGPDGTLFVYDPERGTYVESDDYLLKLRLTIRYDIELAQGVDVSQSAIKEAERSVGDIAPRLLDKPPEHIVNLQNCLYDLERREALDHSPGFLSTTQLGVCYDPDAACPRWEQFSKEVLPADAHEAGLLWQVVAWLMTPITSLQVALLLYGGGANGKGVFLEALERFLGKANVSATTIEQLEDTRFASSTLMRKLVNIVGDMTSTTLRKTSAFKDIVGENTIRGERKFKDEFAFKPYARLVFAGNHLPVASDATKAFFRRWVILPFPRYFPPEIADKGLKDKLSTPEELSGLLNKAIAAWTNVRKSGFTIVPSMEDAHHQLMMENNPLILLLDELLEASSDDFVVKQSLRSRVAHVLRESEELPPGDKDLKQAMKRAFPHVKEKRVPKSYSETRPPAWFGVCWKGTVPETPDALEDDDTENEFA